MRRRRAGLAERRIGQPADIAVALELDPGKTLAVAVVDGDPLAVQGLRHLLRIGGGQGGAITAALFMRKFVTSAKSWVHFDIFAWTPTAKAGRPEGGECQAARALYKLLGERYA